MALMGLGRAAQALATQIEALGVAAFADPERAVAPCAVVFPGLVRMDRIDAETTTVEWDVYLVSGNHGTTEALDDLGEMLAVVGPALAAQEATPTSIILSSYTGDGSLPALQLRVVTEVTPE